MSEEITETNTINNEQNNENNNNNNENNNSNNPQQGIIDAPISKEMKNCYLSYAMSVIVSRAIPDVRDGLKPVHRRILYAANDLGCAWNRQHKKSARIVGEVMGKYHPHGDSSIYDALVRLAQDFSMRVPLINGQGNFGSVDNDPPAAMRYTEARLAKVAHTMMQDLDKETVDFTPNFDGTEKEPVVLPAMFPNILVNGTEGIAVGMATNIPTHNLGELIDACLAYIDNPQITPQELVKIVPGPDFPTGGVILSRNLAMQAMLTGRGAIPVRGKSHVEELKGGREAIVITEIPYQVIKVDMIKKIADLVKEKKLEGISNIRDESNKNGIRIVIELKKDTSTDIVLNYLYKYTALQSSFAVNMLLLNKNRPELMNLHSIIKAFIDFRQEVVSRRTIFLLSQSRSRAHILIGFHVAVDNIDKVISIIRSSKDTQEAKTRLMAEQWEASDAVKQLIDLVQDKNNKVVDGKFSFTEAQVKAIIEMRLSRLTGIERENLANEIKELSLAIMDYLETLHNKAKLMGIISNELQAIKDEYATPRKTEIIDAEIGSTNIEDFIEKKDVLVSVSTGGYIKRTDLSSYTTQNRGGKGKIGMSTLEDDQVRQIFIANTHSPILFFTNNGKVYRIKAYQLPDVAPNAKGRSFVNFVKVEQGDTIAGLMPLPVDKNEWKQYDLIFATKKGNVRRSSIADFENINSNGKIAISLDEDDQLIRVLLAKKDDNIFLSTKNGMAICFKLDDLRIIKSRTSNGVRGIKLKDNDEVVSMCIIGSNEIEIEKRDMYLSLDAELRKNLKNAMNSETGIIDMELQSQLQDAIAKMDRTKFTLTIEEIKECAKKDQTLLTITSDGIGKRSSSLCYKVQNRGGSGLINIKLDNNQSVVTTLLANDDNEIIIIGNKGKTIRTLAKDIRETSRNTKGVKTINLENGEFVASASVVF